MAPAAQVRIGRPVDWARVRAEVEQLGYARRVQAADLVALANAWGGLRPVAMRTRSRRKA
jgi:hypothetical protein